MKYSIKGSFKGKPVNAHTDNWDHAKEVSLQIYGDIFQGNKLILTYVEVKNAL
tara:strand:- start:9609 stop:9767 length:159 start_codon:yes stop_codon:yes gene_type:complete